MWHQLAIKSVMKTLFNVLIFGLLSIAALLAFAWSQPEYRYTISQYYLVIENLEETQALMAFTDNFSDKNIQKTCPGTPTGQYYQACYLPLQAEYKKNHPALFVTQITFGGGADELIERESKAAELAGQLTLVTQLKFYALRNRLQTLRDSQGYQPKNIFEAALKSQWEVNTLRGYTKLSSEMETQFSRMPAGEGTQYQQLLAQYNAAIATN
jgi:hypothetical protein